MVISLDIEVVTRWKGVVMHKDGGSVNPSLLETVALAQKGKVLS